MVKRSRVRRAMTNAIGIDPNDPNPDIVFADPGEVEAWDNPSEESPSSQPTISNKWDALKNIGGVKKPEIPQPEISSEPQPETSQKEIPEPNWKLNDQNFNKFKEVLGSGAESVKSGTKKITKKIGETATVVTKKFKEGEENAGNPDLVPNSPVPEEKIPLPPDTSPLPPQGPGLGKQIDDLTDKWIGTKNKILTPYQEYIANDNKLPFTDTTIANKFADDNKQYIKSREGNTFIMSDVWVGENKKRQEEADRLSKTWGNRTKKVISAVDKGVGGVERFLGVEENSNNDKYAVEAGAKILSAQLEADELNYSNQVSKIQSDLTSTSDTLSQLKVKEGVAAREWDTDEAIYNKIKDDPKISPSDKINAQLKYLESREKYNNIRSEIAKNSSTERRLKENLIKGEALKKLTDDRRNEYNIAVVKGKEIYKRKHGVRNEWLKPISENAENMLGGPVKIGSPSDMVPNKLTSTGVSKGFADIVKPVVLPPGASAWFETQAGDKNFVPGLLFKPSPSVPYLGIPSGTRVVAQYVEPSLNKIGINDIIGVSNIRGTRVSDVTATPRYRITPEDIKRNKSKKFNKPNVMRPLNGIKTISIPDNKKTSIKGISINGNLPMLSKSISTKQIPSNKTNNSIKRISMSGNITLNIPKIPKFNLPNNGLKYSAITNIEKSKNNDVKLNLNSIEKSKGNDIKLNLNGIVPFTAKNIEFNMNILSTPIMKKKLTKVKL